MAQTATIVTTFDRLRNGQAGDRRRPGLGFAANFLYTLTGKRPDDVMERAFDVALTLHADHELNASTFAARVTAATLSDIYSSITSGHRRAERPAARRRQPGRHQVAAAAWATKRRPSSGCKSTLARKVKIPGFGHRVYRTEDPRATHLRVLSEELGKRTGHEKLYRMSQAHGGDGEGRSRA